MPSGEIILTAQNGLQKFHFGLETIVNNLFRDIDYTEIDLDVIFLERRKDYRRFTLLLNEILIEYYSHPKVVGKITKKDEAPFPEGNFVKEGDIYLLEDVYLRGEIYKKV